MEKFAKQAIFHWKRSTLSRDEAPIRVFPVDFAFSVAALGVNAALKAPTWRTTTVNNSNNNSSQLVTLLSPNLVPSVAFAPDPVHHWCSKENQCIYVYTASSPAYSLF